MQRETKEVTTPAGKKLILKTYITARERNELRNVYLSAMKLDTENGATQVKEVGGAVLEQAERKLLEVAIVEYDGKVATTDVLNALLDGTPTEYDFVVAEANKINTGNLAKAK